jgi:FdrA protein
VGVIGASGTGIQQIMCLLDASGVGISHAIGVGSRDLRAEVGGLMTCHAVGMLAADAGTGVIVIVSKPPDRQALARVLEAAAGTGKPVVLALPGLVEPPEPPPGVDIARTLEVAAARAADLAGGSPCTFDARPARPPVAGHIRGLFCGGTLCYEAMAIASNAVGRVASNTPLRPEWRLGDVRRSEGHTFIDFGDDELTEGRVHPMIDPGLRNERFEREAADGAVGAVAVDVVLGQGAHPDPAAELAPLVAGAPAIREGSVHAIVSLCGAAGDPQRLDDQRAALSEAGATVTRSNAHAARLALLATRARGGAA